MKKRKETDLVFPNNYAWKFFQKHLKKGEYNGPQIPDSAGSSSFQQRWKSPAWFLHRSCAGAPLLETVGQVIYKSVRASYLSGGMSLPTANRILREMFIDADSERAYELAPPGAKFIVNKFRSYKQLAKELEKNKKTSESKNKTSSTTKDSENVKNSETPKETNKSEKNKEFDDSWKKEIPEHTIPDEFDLRGGNDYFISKSGSYKPTKPFVYKCNLPLAALPCRSPSSSSKDALALEFMYSCYFEPMTGIKFSDLAVDDRLSLHLSTINTSNQPDPTNPDAMLVRNTDIFDYRWLKIIEKITILSPISLLEIYNL